MRLLFFLLLLFTATITNADTPAPFIGSQWIGATDNVTDTLADRSIIITRDLRCPKNVRSATVNICGLGFYELYIDGRKVGHDLMSPAWSDYNKTLFYNTRDVTSMLTIGRHTVSVLLGNGFYHERGVRYHKLKTSYGPLTLLFNLDITFADGTTATVVSDKQWRWRKSPIVYNSIYGGEDYYAPMEKAAKTDWQTVTIQTPPKGTLQKQLSEPVKIMERYGIANRLSSTLYDMGQNLSGFPEITVRGKRGQSIKLIVGETIKDGKVNQKQTGRHHYYTYTLKGDGQQEIWHPRFSYYGYRYIEVEGAVMEGDDNPRQLPVIESLTSCFVYNSAPKTGSFECSNPLLNETYHIIDRAIRSNWHSVWTDCPHREKLGWLEQDWLNASGLMHNYDCRRMIEQEMTVIADAQHADGSMPEIAPEYIKFEGSWAPPFQESPEWGGALVALPFMYQDFYGDDTLVKKYKPQMLRYVNYLATRDSSYILKQGLGDWYDYGPWKAGFARNTPVPLVSTAHYYLWTKMVGLDARADSIKQAFINTFPLQSQTAYAIALEMGLYPLGTRQAVIDSLVADIHRHGDRLTTGDIGTMYLFRALINNSHAELLYKMLNHRDVPGYGAQLARGMTTLTEQWNPDQGASRNHFMLGHINNHLMQDFAGLRLQGDSIIISPTPVGDLTWARATAQATAGRVTVEWRISNSTLHVNVQTPDKAKTRINYEKINHICRERGLSPRFTVTSTK